MARKSASRSPTGSARGRSPYSPRYTVTCDLGAEVNAMLEELRDRVQARLEASGEGVRVTRSDVVRDALRALFYQWSAAEARGPT
jgi:Arc/MetJ-type ribon-helix-helix transcriptional regulator